MTSRHSTTIRRLGRAQRGFTLIELMITMAIALFLLGGLVTILQNVRTAYNSQQALAQLADQQRFAMTVLTDVIQAGGYFPDPVVWQPTTALPLAGAYAAGQAFTGAHAAGTPDSIGVRYLTANLDGVILCTGATNNTGGNQLYTNVFTVVPPAPPVPGQLTCSLNGAAAVVLVTGVQNLLIHYGVKRDFTTNDYNVDTYLTADQMSANDWSNLSSVRLILTFTNPLFAQPGQLGQGQQPATITFERVVEVMARAGPHT
jgi:type IV pilus assembly protein PilW